MRRRRFFASAALSLGLGRVAIPRVSKVDYPEVTPGRRFYFPRDYGAHPRYRTEWWYATGWLATRSGASLGVQVTFFRVRTPWRTDNPSVFTPRQLLFAHAALADPSYGRLRFDQRVARPVLGLAGASETIADVWIGDWRFALEGRTYRASVAAHDFALALECTAHAPPVLEGKAGYSRKGSGPGQASYYYSRPQLAVRGAIKRGRGKEVVIGTAWLDHEWSSDYLAKEASGWDWCGINLQDGGALMAFRIRKKTGGVYYAGGTLAAADWQATKFGPDAIGFAPLHYWRSPRTGIDYPVAMRVTAGSAIYELEPLMDDQELDARATTGNVYWEGAVRAKHGGKEVGRGYLELTGYGKPLEM